MDIIQQGKPLLYLIRKNVASSLFSIMGALVLNLMQRVITFLVEFSKKIFCFQNTQHSQEQLGKSDIFPQL